MSRSLPVLALVLVAPLAAHEPGVVAGRVKDASGRPLAGAGVVLSGVGLNQRALTDAEGRFRFEKLPKGAYQLLVSRPEYLGLKRLVSLEQEHGVELDLTLHPYTPTAQVEVADKAGVAHLSDLDAPLNHLLGIADTASQGIVTPEKLEERAYLRAAEVLETVPGLVISQHSGEGKANQYYLRGFNLDHGTDVATSVDGLPVNMPTHGHGQGYSDLNFLIPELVRDIQYEKGPYFAQEGDFASAGAVHIAYLHALDQPLAKAELGGEGYRRFLSAGSFKLGDGDLLGAVELFHNDGPWERPDDYRKANGVLRYSWSGAEDVLEFTALAYSGRWNATDQVPQRAIDAGLIDRFGAVDPTDGGRSHRASLVFSWLHSVDGRQTKLEAFVSRYALDLYSDFTYFLNDPVNGDQFHQFDRRVLSGLKLSQRWNGSFLSRPMDTEIGLQVRNDNITGVGLELTKAQQRLSGVRSDQAVETSEGFYLESRIQWGPAFRTVLGAREDLYQFTVRADRPENAGQSHATLSSPKASAIFGPWRDTELYLSFGYGFHSNDGRGTTITVDPSSGAPVEKVTPLVRSRGYELGLRSSLVPAWQTTFSLWRLDLDSELLFSGDGGGTEPSRPSARIGVEWGNEVHLGSLTVNADLAWSRARYRDFDPVGDHVPGSIAGVGLLGLSWKAAPSLDLSVLDRWFGPRDLVEDGGVRSRAANQVQLQARWRPMKPLTLTFEVFNALDAKASDIDYFYTSRLPGEAAGGVEDIHTHPVEPRALRVGMSWSF